MDTMKKDNGGIKIDGISSEEERTWKYLQEQQHVNALKGASEMWVKGYNQMSPQLVNVPHIEALVIPYWKPVSISGKSNDKDFFFRLANNMFNVNSYLRKWDERDYLPTRCRWHDTFGHLPLLWNERYARFTKSLGLIASFVQNKEDLEKLIRLYWYTIEFSLIQDSDGSVKALGAGIISSPGEIDYAVLNPTSEGAISRMHEFNLDQIFQTGFVVDDFQSHYFVIEDFRQLEEALKESVKRFL